MSTNKKINLKELDINNIGGWPRQAQMGFCVILALIIILLGWWLFVRGKQKELEKLEGQETELRTEFENKQGRASNIEPLKQQLAQMEQQLQQMLRQLPSKTEMRIGLVDISQTAWRRHENELFQPRARPRKSSTPRSRSRCAWGYLPSVRRVRERRGFVAAGVIMTMPIFRGSPKDAKTTPMQGSGRTVRSSGREP